jgi:8-oxo-dGTP pyrophosphatase MutT (NUDIX family)
MDISQLHHAFQQPFHATEFRELDIYIRKTAEEARSLIPPPKESAVLIIVHLVNKKPHLLLIKRPIYKGVHSGQMAFPGGKKEIQDSNLLETALREVHEELGILIDKELPFFSLRELYIPPSHFLVQSFLCIIPELPELKPNHEVSEVIQIPLSHLLRNEIIVQHEIEIYPTQEKKFVPAIQFENHFIWGATAMMLFEIRARLLSLNEPFAFTHVPTKN